MTTVAGGVGRRRPEPERTCVACRRKGSKRDLVRIVRAPDGSVRVDPTGNAPGRGAYVHPDPACRREAARRGGLARALRVDRGATEAAGLLRQLGVQPQPLVLGDRSANEVGDA